MPLEERQKLLIETAEMLFPLLPEIAAKRLDELMVDAIMSDWEETKTSKFAISMVIAYSTYINTKYPCIWISGGKNAQP